MLIWQLHSSLQKYKNKHNYGTRGKMMIMEFGFLMKNLIINPLLNSHFTPKFTKKAQGTQRQTHKIQFFAIFD
jgi:hypothetical protein